MRREYKAAVLGGLALGAGIAVRWRWRYRMPLKEYTRYALYMAVLDDEICRNELEGNRIGGETIEFPPRMESLQYRYQMFLNMNRHKSRKQLQKEIDGMEERLEESRQYVGKSKEELELEICRKARG